MKAISIQRSACLAAASSRCGLRRSFTLTELMIAVAVLIVVIVGTSKIFGTASKITGLGQATASVMTEAATIERMMRDDLAKLTTEGFFAIRCVEVRNDVHVATGGPLLNPNLPGDARIRADQLLFFANGVNSMQTFRPSADDRVRIQGTSSRVYWGHAFQLRNGSPALVQATNDIHAHDPIPVLYNPATFPFPAPTPWHRSSGAATNIGMQTNAFGTFGGVGTTGAGTNFFGPTTPAAGPTSINGTQPDPRQWLLARQSVMLVDDDDEFSSSWFQNFKTIWPNNGIEPHVTARSIFVHNAPNAPWGYSREIRNGRLDAAASELDDIRRWVLFNNGLFNPTLAQVRPWIGTPGPDQRTIIQSAVYYPRAERKAPSANRIDQALTNHVIGSACSSFAIDWTYDDGVGRVTDSSGNVITSPGGTVLWGVQINRDIEQPWFGLPDVPGAVRGVQRLFDWASASAGSMPPIEATNIETFTAAPPAGVRDYWATFGYNQTQPLDPTTGEPWLATTPVANAYTPFPSAIRVTMTLHDPEGKLEGGREVQFVIRLPRRNQE